VSSFQVDTNWNVRVGDRIVGELDSLDFREVCGAPTPPLPVEQSANGRTVSAGIGRPRKPAARVTRSAKQR
jgi:hypothetical protein